MEQLEIAVLYNLRCENAASMFDLCDVVAYIAKRVSFIPGRVWFGAGAAINMTFTGNQQRNFLRFLNRHELRRFLVFDALHKRAIGADRLHPDRMSSDGRPRNSASAL